MKIVIGKSGSSNVAFNLETLLRTRLLLYAASGNGKSWALRKLMEELFGHVQVICIDPEGEFATLRDKYAFVLVGQGGEVPADVRIAGETALKLLELRASAVCDLYEMKEADRHLWVQRFLDAMIQAPKKLWRPVVVIVDEAQMFCPEKGQGESVASESVMSLAGRGRKRGYCMVAATQSLAQLNKTATKNLLNRMVGGTFEDVDIKRAVDLLSVAHEDQREFKASLRMLEPGQFYAFGRAVSKTRLLFRVGDVQTRHPEAGASAAAPPPPPERVKELLGKLAEIPKVAEEKARTVADLQKQVRDLKAELSAAKRAQPKTPAGSAQVGAPAGISEREVQRRIDAAVKPWRTLVEDCKRRATRINGQLAQAFDAVTAIETVELPAGPAPVLTMPSPKPNGHAPEPRAPRLQPAAPVELGEAPPIGAAAQRLVAILFAYPDGITRGQAMSFVGVADRTLTNVLTELRSVHAIDTTGSKLKLSDIGREQYAALASAAPDIPQSTEDVVAIWKPKVGAAAGRLLDLLVDSPDGITRNAAMDWCGIADRTLTNVLTELRRTGLLGSAGVGTIAPNKEALFL